MPYLRREAFEGLELLLSGFGLGADGTFWLPAGDARE